MPWDRFFFPCYRTPISSKKLTKMRIWKVAAKIRNFERPFTPRTKLGSARNFGKTRFRRFAIFHFSALKNCWDNCFRKLQFFFKEVAFWTTYEFLSVTGRSVVKSYCPKWVYFWGDFLGGGVNDSICVENLDLARKMTSTIWCWDEKILASIFFSRNWSFGGAGIFLTRDSRSVVKSYCPKWLYF